MKAYQFKQLPQQSINSAHDIFGYKKDLNLLLDQRIHESLNMKQDSGCLYKLMSMTSMYNIKLISSKFITNSWNKGGFL